MNVQTIPVANIDPPLFNSRMSDNVGTEQELKTFGASLKARQLEPIGVVPINGGNRFRLIWGSRRVAGAKAVGMDSIEADVLPPSAEVDEVLANGVENIQRKDLTTYEQARLCAKLRELKKSGKEVSAALGLSVQHVSNLALCYEHLPDDVKESWRKGETATDINFLRSIITKQVDGKTVQATPEEMTALYRERVQALSAVSGDEEDDEEGDEDDNSNGASVASAGIGPPKKFTVQKERYKALLKALRSIRASQMTIDACRYLVGDIEKIRGVPVGDPKAPTKKTNNETKGK